MKRLGRWAFLVGLVIAVVAGVITPDPWMFWTLAILGLVVGVLNVTGEEETTFFLAAIAFMVSTSALVSLPMVGAITTQVMGRVAMFVSAALIVVALKTVFRLAKD